jgi:hypothetical protein
MADEKLKLEDLLGGVQRAGDEHVKKLIMLQLSAAE